MANSVAAVKTYEALRNLGVREANGYFQNFLYFLTKTKASFSWSYEDIERREGKVIELADAINSLIKLLDENQINKKKIMVIGNGGSAGIAMHALADYANTGEFRTVDLYNPALLTCMSNDYGYENVFVKPIEMFAEAGDMLFAISSSGESPNIVKAAKAAKACGCIVATFSGFEANNPLRRIGELNFYTPSTHYGFVELAHQTIIHCILDLFARRVVYEEIRQLSG